MPERKQGVTCAPPSDAVRRRELGLWSMLTAAEDPSVHRHEGGGLMRLADFECQHGRLPGDRLDARCSCWAGTVEEEQRRAAEAGEEAAA